MKKVRTPLLSIIVSSAILFSCNTYAHNETLSVGFIKADRLPYFANKTETQPVRGLYVDLLERISHYSGIKFSYNFTPQARIRLYMKKGLLDVEPGIDKGWRQNPEEIKNSVYSIPFMNSKEVMAYNIIKFPNFSPSDPNLLNCAVLGFTESNAKNPENRLMTEVQILDMLQKKRCDTATFPIDVLNYHLTNSHSDVKYTQPLFNYSLRLRLHKSKHHLLDKIDNSIRKLLDSGEFAQLYSKYTLK